MPLVCRVQVHTRSKHVCMYLVIHTLFEKTVIGTSTYPGTDRLDAFPKGERDTLLSLTFDTSTFQQ